MTVTYRLSEDATTTFTVDRIDRGRRRGSSCQRPSSSTRRGTPCSRYVRISGSFRDAGEAAATNSVRFTGRVLGRRLKPGRYRLTAVARDAAGNVATAATTFVIRR